MGMCGCAGVRHSIGGADYGSVRAGAFMGLRIMTQLQADRGPEPLGQLVLCLVSVLFPILPCFEQSCHDVFAAVLITAYCRERMKHSLAAPCLPYQPSMSARFLKTV